MIIFARLKGWLDRVRRDSFDLYLMRRQREDAGEEISLQQILDERDKVNVEVCEAIEILEPLAPSLPDGAGLLEICRAVADESDRLRQNLKEMENLLAIWKGMAEQAQEGREVKAEARARTFRPRAEVLSATRECLRATPGATVAQVHWWLAGWPNLGEPATEDLALAALQELRRRGQASEGPPKGTWSLR